MGRRGDGETRRWGDGNADETDSLWRSADSYGFLHRDAPRFFEVDGVERDTQRSKCQTLHLTLCS